MARLVGTIHRYTGNSREIKPHVGQRDVATGVELAVGDLPIGSTFYEEDTGDQYGYTGEGWELDPSTALIRSMTATLDKRVNMLVEESLKQTSILERIIEDIP